MSDVYLREHPPARKQFTSPRRQAPAGVIGVHTAEGAMDTVTADTGAENTAAYIARRDTAGSYHDIVDSDSRIQLVRYGDEAYHIATHTLNRRTTGLSFACRTTDWAKMSTARRQGFLRNGAKAAADQVRYHAAHGKQVPVRRITLAQALASECGFLAHGDADPARRSDPGVNPPDLFPWDEFFRYVVAELRATPAPRPPTGALTVDQYAELNARIAALEAKVTGNDWRGVAEDTAQNSKIALMWAHFSKIVKPKAGA